MESGMRGCDSSSTPRARRGARPLAEFMRINVDGTNTRWPLPARPVSLGSC